LLDSVMTMAESCWCCCCHGRDHLLDFIDVL